MIKLLLSIDCAQIPEVRIEFCFGVTYCAEATKRTVVWIGHVTDICVDWASEKLFNTLLSRKESLKGSYTLLHSRLISSNRDKVKISYTSFTLQKYPGLLSGQPEWGLRLNGSQKNNSGLMYWQSNLGPSGSCSGVNRCVPVYTEAQLG